MDKIYSRNRIKIPKGDAKKALTIVYILLIAIITFNVIVNSISPIIDRKCINITKSIATKITNEQTNKVMSKYKYGDLCNIEKDSMRKYFNGKCKCCFYK